jgi:hypothetical protein
LFVALVAACLIALGHAAIASAYWSPPDQGPCATVDPPAGQTGGY